MKTKDFFVSWDFLIGLVIGVGSWCLLPDVVMGTILKELYFSAIAVLAIIFPIFFAALAIMMSFSDNDFVGFLEEDGIFSQLLSHFSFSITFLFGTLITSLILYGFVLFHLSDPGFGQLRIQVAFYNAVFFYTLTAVYLATLDAIKYLKHRIRFIQLKGKR